MTRILKHLVSFSLLGVILLEQLLFSVSYAQTSEVVKCEDYTPDCSKTTICSTHSEEFQIYINFIIDMVNALKGLSTEQEYVESMSNLGLFSNNVLKFPAKQLATLKLSLKLGVEDFVKGYNAVIFGSAIFFNIGKDALSDPLISFKILFRSKPFVRDYGTLLDMEAYLNDFMYELAVDGKYGKEIAYEAIPTLQTVLNEYMSVQPLFSTAIVREGVTYSDIVSALFDLTSTMKILMRKKRDSSNEFLTILKNKGNVFVTPDEWGGFFMLQFNTNTICIMHKKYVCASEGCNQSWSEIWKNFSGIGILKSAVTQSMKEITDANAELKKTLAKIRDNVKNKKKNTTNPNLRLTEYQQELLRTVYGIDTTKLTSKQGIGLSDFFDPSNLKSIKIKGALQVKTLFDTEENVTTNDASATNKAISDLRALAQQNREAIEGEIEEVTSYVEPSGLLTSNLSAAMNDVIQAHATTFDRMLYGQNTDTTRHFKEIGVFIQNTISDYIGTKDTDGLIKFLGQTCETQCVNRGIDGCYYAK